MSDTNTVAITAFPMDSKVESFGEDGLPVYDRAFSSADLRNFIGATYNNGYFADTADSLKPTLAVVGGEEHSGYVTEPVAYISLAAGTVCINGVLGFIPDETVLTPVNNVADGSSAAVVARLNLAEGKRNIEVTFGVENAITNDKNALTIAVATRSGNSFTLTDYRGQAGYCPEVTRKVTMPDAGQIVTTEPVNSSFNFDGTLAALKGFTTLGTFFCSSSSYLSYAALPANYRMGHSVITRESDTAGGAIHTSRVYPAKSEKNDPVTLSFGDLNLGGPMTLTSGTLILQESSRELHDGFIIDLNTADLDWRLQAESLCIDWGFNLSYEGPFSDISEEGAFLSSATLPLRSGSWGKQQVDFVYQGTTYYRYATFTDIPVSVPKGSKERNGVAHYLLRIYLFMTRREEGFPFPEEKQNITPRSTYALRTYAELLDFEELSAIDITDMFFNRVYLT